MRVCVLRPTYRMRTRGLRADRKSNRGVSASKYVDVSDQLPNSGAAVSRARGPRMSASPPTDVSSPATTTAAHVLPTDRRSSVVENHNQWYMPESTLEIW